MMENILWIFITIFLATGAIFAIATVYSRGWLSWDVFKWIGIGAGCVVIGILLTYNWGKISSFVTINITTPWFTMGTWWVIGGTLFVLLAIIAWWRKWYGFGWLPRLAFGGCWTHQDVMHGLKIACAITFIAHVLATHTALGNMFFGAYWHAVQDFNLGMSVLGFILAIWLLRDKAVLPVRKILAAMVVLIASYLLVDFLFPNLGQWLSSLSPEEIGRMIGDGLNFLLRHWFWVLGSILLIAAIFIKAIRTGALRLFGLLLAVVILLPLFTAGSSSSPKPGNEKKVVERVTVTSDRYQRVEFPKLEIYGYGWDQSYHGPEGEDNARPTPLCWKKAGEEGILYVDDPADATGVIPEGREPLFVKIATQDNYKGPVVKWTLTVVNKK